MGTDGFKMMSSPFWQHTQQLAVRHMRQPFGQPDVILIRLHLQAFFDTFFSYVYQVRITQTASTLTVSAGGGGNSKRGRCDSIGTGA